MRYLYRPTQVEEMIVRGRYKYTSQGKPSGSEQWARYRQQNSDIQVWRGQWERFADGLTLLTHLVVSPEGAERLKVRLSANRQPLQNLTLTFMPDHILLHDDNTFHEVALPPEYGLVAPPLSLARLAFPFDLASNTRELAMTFLLRLQGGRLHYRPTKFGYTPLGLRDFTIKGQTLRAKGWRMEVPGFPVQEGWFDRYGTCLMWRSGNGSRAWEATLTEWFTFA